MTSISLAAANVRGQGRRLVSVLVAIAVSVAFVTACLALSDSLSERLTRDVRATVGASAVVVTGPGRDGTVPPALVEQLRAAHPDTEVRAVATGFVRQLVGGREAFLALRSVPRLSSTTTLEAGRLPAAGEIALAADAARSRDLAIGQVVRLKPLPDGQVRDLRLVGLVHPGADAVDATGNPWGFLPERDLWTLTGTTGYRAVYAGNGATDAARLKTAVAALPAAKSLTVRTGAEERDARMADLGSEVAVITSALLVFAIIATFVAMLVIANTFAILVAQRTRQLALLRCIGAERRQVRGSVVVEAVLVGVVGSLVGVGLGLALAAGAVRLSAGTPMDLGGLTAAPATLLVPPVVGVLVTLVAALMPARAATRVTPLAALRPQPASRGRRVARTRLVLGALGAVAGTVLLVLGARAHSMALGVPGGLVSFVGIMLLAPVVVPALAALVGGIPARLWGVPGALAVDNSRRNPARAAATASALLVGVTLITMTTVAAASATRSGNDSLDRRYPVDATVQAAKGLTAADLATVRRSRVVEQAALVTRLHPTLSIAGRDPQAEDVTGITHAAGQVSRRARSLAGLDDGTVLLTPQTGARTGDRVRLTQGGRTIELRAHVGDEHPSTPVVTAATARRLDPAAPAAAWVRLVPGADAAAIAERLATDTAQIPGSQTASVAGQRAELQRVMDTALMVVTGLLAFSVLIALVGIGNTLGLSVLERTQESGLLRALGLERRQLRAMLGLEALTLAGVGTLVGLALGVGYGVAAAHAALGGDLTVAIDIPWARLALVAAVALAAGWAASVIPAHRAARVSPSAALATE
ncbi:FtsX-like permease family protein [Arsenicicoccus dermatophilus]|uniref:FtsX-like permease family protein n=1 Tax=Arsenicicoccus dermatophilus TaxID=1076331 RepID=UPI0039171C8F